MNHMYNTGSSEIGMRQVIDVLVDPIKAMLVGVLYVADKDDDVVDAGGANDAVDHEVTGTGYVPGYGGAGRKTLASKTLTTDKTNNRDEFDCADLVWSGIDTVLDLAQLLVILEGVANDTTSRLIAHVDSGFPKATNGGDITVTINAEGLLQLTN